MCNGSPPCQPKITSQKRHLGPVLTVDGRTRIRWVAVNAPWPAEKPTMMESEMMAVWSLFWGGNSST